MNTSGVNVPVELPAPTEDVYTGGLTRRGVGVRRTVEKALADCGLTIGGNDAPSYEHAAWVVVDHLRGLLPDDCYDERIES